MEKIKIDGMKCNNKKVLDLVKEKGKLLNNLRLSR